MFRRISKVKLCGRSSITANVKIYSRNSIRCSHNRIFNWSCLVGMLESHFIGVIPEFIKIIRNLLITDIYACPEAGEVNIYPVWVFRSWFKKSCIPDYFSIFRVFKSIRIARLVKNLICMLRKGNFKISPGFGRVIAIAGNIKYFSKKNDAQAGWTNDFLQWL